MIYIAIWLLLVIFIIKFISFGSKNDYYMNLTFTKSDLPIYCQTIYNCITSCNNFQQLKVSEEMIVNYISERFKNAINESELYSIETHLREALVTQKKLIDKRYSDYMESPTLERYLFI